MAKLSKRRRSQLALLLILMLLGAIAELATLGSLMPFLAVISDPDGALSHQWTKRFFGMLGWTEPSQIVLSTSMLFGSVVLIAGAIRVLLAWVSQKFVFRLSHDLSSGVYKTAIHQPFSYHAATNTSELIASINKVQIVTMGLLLPLIQAAISAVIAIFLLGALLLINPGIVLLAAGVFAAAYVAVSFLTRRRLRSNSEIIAKAQVDRVQTIQEGLGGIRDVLLDRAQPIYFQKFARADLSLRDARTMNIFISSSPRYVIETFCILLIAGLALFLSGTSGGLIGSLPMLGALALGAQRILPAANNIYNGWAQIKGNQQLLIDVLELMEMPINSARHTGANILPLPFNQEIILTDVGFAYSSDDGDKLVIDHVNLVIKRGTRMAVIGKTGSGKSTLVDLIMGLLKPAKGTIQVDGQILNDETVQNWQTHIAHVSQDVYLSDATLAENIAFGVPIDQIDWARIRRAAEQAAVAAFIESLPNGYRTVAGERGIGLSGGQKQRIGIARALYKQADVLILDEATSALDRRTEVEVMDAIQKLGRDITIVTVAHRLSEFAQYDQIFRVESGQVLTDNLGNL